MKKFKTLLCALLAAGGITVAAQEDANPDAVTVYLDVTGASNLTMSNSNKTFDLIEGENKFVFTENTYFTVALNDPSLSLSVIDTDTGYPEYISNGAWSMQTDLEYEAGKVCHFKVTAYNAEEARTSSFTVKTDDPAAFTLYRDNDHMPVSCEENETTVKFNHELETVYMIDINSGFSVYKIQLNDNDVEERYSRYSVTVKDGDVLNIITEFPDEEATITFSYNEGGKGCISDVRVNSDLVSDFDGETLKVKLGDVLSFYTATNWHISSYTLNGKTENYFSSFNGTVRGDMNFRFIAEYDDPNITFNIEVDNASAVKYSYYSNSTYSTVSEILQAGNNQIKVERSTSITFEPIEPYGFKEIINLDNNTPVTLNGSTWYLYASNDAAKNYKITTINEDDARTATATFNIDNADNVNVRRNKDGYSFELKNGKNEIKFNHETETSFTVMSKSDVPLWEVKMGGETVTSDHGYYELTLTDGCTVDITATIPDIDVKATFEITDEDAAANLITGVKVNGEDVDFDGTSIDLKAGQKIALTFDGLYKVDKFMVGEREEYIYSTSYTSPVLMEDTKFVIAAHRLSTIKVKVIVDDPGNITVGNGYSMYSEPRILELAAGENEVELPENNTMICWQIKDGCDLLSVKYNETDVNFAYYSNQTMEENSVIEFTTAKINYDKTAVVWVDDRSAAENFFSLQGNGAGDRKSIEVNTGYTEFSFRDAMLPLDLSWYGTKATVGKVYINNNPVEPAYQGSNSYTLPIEDGDVIKVFLAVEPVESKLTFDVEEGLEVTATTDRIVTVSDLAAEHTVFNGTEVALTLADNKDVIVKNGETELTAGEDGKYTVTVNGDTNLSVKKAEQDGIREIGNTQSAGNSEVYDLQGRRVNKASRGLYIINGKKVMVK